jgi:hypothetical protein
MGDSQCISGAKQHFCPNFAPVALYVGSSRTIFAQAPLSIPFSPHFPRIRCCGLCCFGNESLPLSSLARGWGGRGIFYAQKQNWGMFQQGCHTVTPMTPRGSPRGNQVSTHSILIPLQPIVSWLLVSCWSVDSPQYYCGYYKNFVLV